MIDVRILTPKPFRMIDASKFPHTQANGYAISAVPYVDARSALFNMAHTYVEQIKELQVENEQLRAKNERLENEIGELRFCDCNCELRRGLCPVCDKDK